MSLNPIANGKSVGPFAGVLDQYDTKVKPIGSAESFRVIIYAAYNAFGLIGPERNGIAILNEDRSNVFCDEIAKASSGYFGPTPSQIETFKKMTAPDITLDAFLGFARTCQERMRYDDIATVSPSPKGDTTKRARATT